MLSLAEHQSQVAKVLLGADLSLLPPVRRIPIPAEVAVKIHGDTIRLTLVNALRLAFPTVQWLLGADAFAAVAEAFVREHPPRTSVLNDYGPEFPDFISTQPAVRSLVHLRDVARLDLAVDRALRASPDRRRSLSIDESVSLSAPRALTVLQLDFPADLIRGAVEDDDEVILDGLVLLPVPRHVAVWAGPQGAMVAALSPPAGTFLVALLGGAAAADALALVVAGEGKSALEAIQAEIFNASFCRIVQNFPQEGVI